MPLISLLLRVADFTLEIKVANNMREVVKNSKSSKNSKSKQYNSGNKSIDKQDQSSEKYQK